MENKLPSLTRPGTDLCGTWRKLGDGKVQTNLENIQKVKTGARKMAVLCEFELLSSAPQSPEKKVDTEL